jgi:hypothetical protein
MTLGVERPEEILMARVISNSLAEDSQGELLAGVLT